MKIDILVLGPIQTNCYIISDETKKKAVVIDPAFDDKAILNYLKERDLSLEAILLTHGHFDHIMAVPGLMEASKTKLYALSEEKELLQNSEWNYSKDFGREISVMLKDELRDGQILKLDLFSVRVIATPGHTKGSACYYLETEEVLFSGDTLFFESAGRTDLPTGNAHSLLESLHDKLFQLPDAVIVYPGHGSDTTIGYEKNNNPYAGQNLWE